MQEVNHNIAELITNVSIVLVETENSINIGSVLRAASNFGIEDIRLVNPSNFELGKVRASACWGDYLIDQIKFYDSLELALTDAHEVYGFSSSFGVKRPPHISLPELLVDFDVNKKYALLFGPEDSGLTIDHMAYCNKLVRIPTTTKNPSINLAQSVLLTVYELSKLNIKKNEIIKSLPTQNEFFHLNRIIDEIGVNSGFFGTGTPEPIPDLLKNLIKRLAPDSHEMGVLLGYFGKVNRTIKRQNNE